MLNFRNINWQITLVSILLVSIGVLVIFSSSKELAMQQLIFAMLGLLFFFLVSKLDLHSISNFAKPLYFLMIFLLLAVIFIGFETRGAIRWIPLGIINIQPSEFAKPILIIFLSRFWSLNQPSWKNITKSILWAFPVFILIFRQPDLGSSLTIISIWIGLLFASRISFKKMLILTVITLIIIPLSWVFLLDYQKQRIISFVSPQSDPLGRGYNLIQSTIAVGSGQLFGMGLGRGTQSRLQFLPEFRTDFIFASIAEELGLIGSTLILFLYLFLIVFCLSKASKVSESINFLTIIACVSMLLFQLFVNIGMNLGLVPVTGITLPLISYGGSSLISTFIILGLITSALRFDRKQIL